jgi:hypothetical protein
MTRDDFFKPPIPDWEVHPMVRHWHEMRRRPEIADAKVELYRPREGLTFRPAQLYVHFIRKDGTRLTPEKEDWDDVLNEGLLKLGVSAVSEENESARFALGLRAALAPIDARFGAAFFNSVLLEVVHETPLATAQAVAQVLDAIHRDNPYMEGNSYSDCKAMIMNVLRERVQELRDDLKYSDVKAEQILADALAQYLDERFSVTNRALLGW